MHPSWSEELERRRKEKDEFFATYHDSPIPHEARETFKGLNYFHPDKNYVIDARLHKYDHPETLTLTTSKGTLQRFYRFGYFEFEINGKSVILHAYKPAEREVGTALFIPFRDKTSGRESYGAARYLDLEENLNDEYMVDFNQAYNPYCAYNDSYVCPLPPTENWLNVEIRAGEEKYHE